MTTVTLTIPPEYGYVAATVALTAFNALWHGGRCGVFRKRAGIVPYPTPYADGTHFAAAKSADQKQALHIFNCGQRAHGNFLENQPQVLALMVVAGLRYPVASAALGLFWNVNRVVYAVGYTKKDTVNGKGRLQGAGFWLAQLGLMGLAAWTGGKMVGLV